MLLLVFSLPGPSPRAERGGQRAHAAATDRDRPPHPPHPHQVRRTSPAAGRLRPSLSLPPYTIPLRGRVQLLILSPSPLSLPWPSPPPSLPAHPPISRSLASSRTEISCRLGPRFSSCSACRQVHRSVDSIRVPGPEVCRGGGFAWLDLLLDRLVDSVVRLVGWLRVCPRRWRRGCRRRTAGSGGRGVGSRIRRRRTG